MNCDAERQWQTEECAWCHQATDDTANRIDTIVESVGAKVLGGVKVTDGNLRTWGGNETCGVVLIRSEAVGIRNDGAAHGGLAGAETEGIQGIGQGQGRRAQQRQDRDARQIT